MQHIVSGKTLVGTFLGGVATGITLAASGICWVGWKYAEYKVRKEQEKDGTETAAEDLPVEEPEET